MNPNRVEAYYYRAVMLYDEEKYTADIEYINAIPETLSFSNKQLGDLSFVLGNCYFELQKYEAAVEYFSEAVSCNKTNSEYYQDYAIALAKLNQITEATRVLNEAIDIGIASESEYMIQAEI